MILFKNITQGWGVASWNSACSVWVRPCLWSAVTPIHTPWLTTLDRKQRDRGTGQLKGVQVPALGSKAGSRMMELIWLWIKSAPKSSNPLLMTQVKIENYSSNNTILTFLYIKEEEFMFSYNVLQRQKKKKSPFTSENSYNYRNK